jgi:hypothetical protein
LSTVPRVDLGLIRTILEERKHLGTLLLDPFDFLEIALYIPSHYLLLMLHFLKFSIGPLSLGVGLHQK